MNIEYDYTIVGGGIVGISTALQLKQALPEKRIVVIEKEPALATHQTGHNSGVIHAGIYYQPGSLKAKFCKEGLKRTVEYCQKHGIAYKQIGKLLVATDMTEFERMLDLFDRASELGIKVELLDQAQLKKREPYVEGIGALFVHDTGIVDYVAMCEKMAQQFTDLGGEIRLNAAVQNMAEDDQQIEVTLDEESFSTRYLIACGGLMADRLARMLDLGKNFQIVPYRGEYYKLNAPHLSFNHLVYPIPDPELPFLGVHITPMIDGSVTVGPNAVQGWKREGYGQHNFSLKDTSELVAFSGFWKVARKHWKQGAVELKNSLFKGEYTKLVKKYCQQIEPLMLEHHPAGIRAQAVLNDGTLVHDFLFEQSKRSLHVCNAPSPAATSAMPIGEYIVSKVLSDFAEQ